MTSDRQASGERQAGSEPQALGAPASPVAVVGCGNWLMATDRVGPRVLAALGRRPRPGVALADVGTSGLGLLDRLWGQELLILVDACVGRAAPGEVLVSHPDPEAALPLPTGTHQIGPLEVLAIARELYPERLPRRIALVQVETGGLGPEQEEGACGRAVAAVERLLDETPPGFVAADAPSAAA